MKFEDRSHEETERRQRCARSKAWNLAKHIYKLKEKDKAAFYFPAEEWVLPAASTKEPEDREFVVDSGASMHMVSEKDLISAELETMRTSRSPTTVMTANGEVQTREGQETGLQGMPSTGGGGRVPNLRVCKHLFLLGVAHAGGEGRIDVLPWYRLVGVATPPVRRPKPSVIGGSEGVRQGNRQGW